MPAEDLRARVAVIERGGERLQVGAARWADLEAGVVGLRDLRARPPGC